MLKALAGYPDYTWHMLYMNAEYSILFVHIESSEICSVLWGGILLSKTDIYLLRNYQFAQVKFAGNKILNVYKQTDARKHNL